MTVEGTQFECDWQEFRANMGRHSGHHYHRAAMADEALVSMKKEVEKAKQKQK